MSTNHLTIVMYHYIRDLARSRYPEIKGMTVEQFRGQLAYLLRYYQIVTAEEVMDALELGHGLPRNAALLTFDDGFLDHYTNVFPILFDKKVKGVFFPPARAIKEGRVLDVHKIHFILASCPNKFEIVQNIFRLMDNQRQAFPLASNDYYYKKYGNSNRLDTGEVVFIKHMLQHILPEELREKIVDNLFKSFVTADESAFAAELYVTLEQLRTMQSYGMYIGSHGYGHFWLDSVPTPQQIQDVDKSLELLDEIGTIPGKWIFSYPSGAYNESLLAILKDRGCVLGLTTEVGIADLSTHNPMLLPRLDTLDLPTDSLAAPNKWTKEVLASKALKVSAAQPQTAAFDLKSRRIG